MSDQPFPTHLSSKSLARRSYGWGDDEPNGATGHTAVYEAAKLAAAIHAAGYRREAAGSAGAEAPLCCAFCDSPDGKKWHRPSCVEVGSAGAEGPRAANETQQRLTVLAARMARGTDICVKGHRADKSEHVHFEGTVLSWARELIAIREMAQGVPPQGLDVERLFAALCNVTGMCWDGKPIADEYARLTPAQGLDGSTREKDQK